MITFVTTYVVFWLVVAAYVMRLGGCQRALVKRMDSLRSQLQNSGRLHSRTLEGNDLRSSEVVPAQQAG